MKRLSFVLLVLLVTLLMTNSARAVGLVNTDDTWVREDSATSNRNGDGLVNARTDADADDNDAIILRFDLTGWTLAGSGNSLNLVWQRNDSSTGKTLSLYGLNETHPDETTWSETTVTYNTCPGLLPDGVFPMNGDPTPQDLDVANLTLLVADQAYGPQVLDEVYTFSSTALDNFLNGDTNGEVTFLIFRNVDVSSNQARFQVREVGTGAYLIPEPATLVLLGLGSLITFRRKR
jgi:hypothetical protein